MAPRETIIGEQTQRKLVTHDDMKRSCEAAAKLGSDPEIFPLGSSTTVESGSFRFDKRSQGLTGADCAVDHYELVLSRSVSGARFTIRNVPETETVHISAFDQNDMQVRVVLSLQKGADVRTCEALSALSVVISEPVSRIELRHERENLSGAPLWLSSVVVDAQKCCLETKAKLVGSACETRPAAATQEQVCALDGEGSSLPEADAFDSVNADAALAHDFLEIDQVLQRVVPCFTPGTLIATPIGERKVEELSIGDRVITRDNGIQQIRWAGRRDLSTHELQAAPHLQPVRIRKGALGNGLPERDMLLSPNHRVLLSSEKAQAAFNDSEVLISARHMIGMPGVEQHSVSRVSYLHFMFDQHEVVLSDGAWTESFQPLDRTLDSMERAQREEIFELFPELRSVEGMKSYPSARRTLCREEAQLVLH